MPLARLAPNSRVLVIRLRSLGDCVLTTPAIRLLKEFRPDLEIGVVVEDRFAAVFENHPDIAAVLPPKVGAVRNWKPALCLNLHGGTRSARITALSGAKYRAGFDIFRPGLIYNDRIPTAQKTLGVSRRVHTAEHLASAIFHLGVPIADIPRASIHVPEAASPYAPEGRYVVIHPFAATPLKTWPSDRFMELARHLTHRTRFEVVFLGGPDEDLAPFHDWHGVSAAPLTEVAQLLRGATLFVGNDSGPAHVAAAFGIPQVVLFGPSDAEVWAPWRTPSRVIRAAGPIERIALEQAIEAVESLGAFAV